MKATKEQLKELKQIIKKGKLYLINITDAEEEENIKFFSCIIVGSYNNKEYNIDFDFEAVYKNIEDGTFETAYVYRYTIYCDDEELNLEYKDSLDVKVLHLERRLKDFMAKIIEIDGEEYILYGDLQSISISKKTTDCIINF